MDPSGSELQELRRLLGELTARVFRIEQALNMRPVVAAEAPAPPPQPGARSEACGAGYPSEAGSKTPPATRDRADLESRIGSHWLNRIGITAVLIGVSYFLKFAFDNNWIGPAGRVAIGLLAGIAIVVWSENFRHRGYVIFLTR